MTNALRGRSLSCNWRFGDEHLGGECLWRKKDAVVRGPRRSPLAIKRFTPSFVVGGGRSLDLVVRPAELGQRHPTAEWAAGYENEGILTRKRRTWKYRGVCYSNRNKSLRLSRLGELLRLLHGTLQALNG